MAGLELEMNRRHPSSWTLRREGQAIDMTGRTVGDYGVKRRAPSVNNAARFYCECEAGHGRYFDGSYLRRPGVAPRCAECTQRLLKAV
jgi:hypothetical protein